MPHRNTPARQAGSFSSDFVAGVISMPRDAPLNFTVRFCRGTDNPRGAQGPARRGARPPYLPGL